MAVEGDLQARRVWPNWTSARCAVSPRGLWVTLAMFAHAFLAVVGADEYSGRTAPDGLIPLSCNGIPRLFTALFGRCGTWSTGSAGPAGGAAIRREPGQPLPPDVPRI